jgi:hypothetical protein
VQQLRSAVTSFGTVLSATPPDPVKLSQSAGNLMNAVTAAVTAGCLPALPTPSTPTPANAQKCLVDEVQLLEATLGVIAAGISTPARPDRCPPGSHRARQRPNRDQHRHLPADLPAGTHRAGGLRAGA